MEKVYITIEKTQYNFENGDICKGVIVQLAPMIQKFIAINDSKFEALGYMNPNFAQWFYNSPDGSRLVLAESSQKVNVSVE